MLNDNISPWTKQVILTNFIDVTLIWCDLQENTNKTFK